MNQPDKIRLGLPMADYLAHPSLAHHDLVPLGRSPAHFKAALAAPDEDTDALRIGEITHAAILEPATFKKSHWVRPETYDDEKGKTKVWNGNSNVCREWLAAHSDRTVIRAKQFEAILAMRKSVLAHRTAREILKQGDFEVSLFGVDPDTGTPLKSRPDWISGTTLVNLKTTEDASAEAFTWAIEKYHYASGAALHLDVARLAGIPKDYYLFIVVEKEPPFAVAVYELDKRSIDKGRQDCRRWLSLYAHCSSVDEWPAFNDGIIPISLPERAFKL
jgi:hypothetical protein